MERAPSTEPWTEAVAEFRAAREAPAGLDSGPDPGVDAWLEALTGTDADLPWSCC